MKGLDHINILPLVGVCVEEGYVPLVLYPHCEEGSVHSFLERCKFSPERQQVRKKECVLCDVARCVSLHAGRLYSGHVRVCVYVCASRCFWGIRSACSSTAPYSCTLWRTCICTLPYCMMHVYLHTYKCTPLYWSMYAYVRIRMYASLLMHVCLCMLPYWTMYAYVFLYWCMYACVCFLCRCSRSSSSWDCVFSWQRECSTSQRTPLFILTLLWETACECMQWFCIGAHIHTYICKCV